MAKNEQTEEDRRKANEEAGRTVDQQTDAAAKRTAEADTFAVGDRVTVLVDTPEGRPVKGTVRTIQEKGGALGVELDDYTAYAHSLEGLVDEREQGDGEPVIGKGWWALPENVAKDEQ